jgi:predicted aminopeptidase
MWMRASIVAVALLLSGCGSVTYYAQAIGGHLDVMSRARPIEELLADESLAPETRARLAEVLAAREFAVTELALPDNGSYRTYADLERPFAVWNVFAAPELSIAPREWCLLMVGCVNYRGYFAREKAQAFASELRAQGYDVYVAGVAAYSTLGWFSDPMLNTILRRSDTEVAALLFHELAHQRLYVKDDSTFNESFATVVELEGARRWLARRGNPAAFAEHAQRLARREQFSQLVLKYRAQLDDLYRSAASDDDKRAGKRTLLRQLKDEYASVRSTWDGDTRYDNYFAQDLNNAHLAAVGTYHRHVQPLQILLAESGGDLPAFYAAAAALAQLPAAEREARLAPSARGERSFGNGRRPPGWAASAWPPGAAVSERATPREPAAAGLYSRAARERSRE